MFAAVNLHFFRTNSKQPMKEETGNIRTVYRPQGFSGLLMLEEDNYVLATRNTFRDYFNGRGRVSWQGDAALLH